MEWGQGGFLFHKKLQQFCRIYQREWGLVCLAFESMPNTPYRCSVQNHPQHDFLGVLRVKRGTDGSVTESVLFRTQIRALCANAKENMVLCE